MMEEGDDVLEHINKIKTLAEQLDAVNAPVSEDDLVITLLASLSESYQFLITALESRADSLTWELVTARLLHEDMKRKEKGGSADGAAHAAHDVLEGVHAELQEDVSGGRASCGRWSSSGGGERRHCDVNEDSTRKQEGCAHERVAHP
ncbi:unnamed protein product [Phytophthora lilii]|uniref:Unnamed protein product n=1 Tax=Phytophthora lilii TaxID=2077276 RepID=A0A9W7CUF0_9STRA|nr:unnamed protein product [Phytophthora lilii]